MPASTHLEVGPSRLLKAFPFPVREISYAGILVSPDIEVGVHSPGNLAA
jgi:hypothetical protein